MRTEKEIYRFKTGNKQLKQLSDDEFIWYLERIYAYVWGE